MARIRSIHPDMCVSETMADAAITTCPRHEECGCLERTFARLWTHCDDHGRTTDNVRLIKAAIYPLHDVVTPAVLDEELNALVRAGLIVRYLVDGKGYIEVSSWGEYQHPDKPKPSKYPASTDGTPLATIEPGQAPFDEPSPTSPRHVPDASGPGEGGEKEREKERETSRRTSSIAPALAVVPDAKATAKPPRAKDPLWDALEANLGPARTPTERSVRGKTRKELAEADATPAEVTDRCREYRTRYPDAALTDSALCKHWSALGTRTTAPTGKRLSGNSQAFLNMLAAAEAADAADSLGTRDYIDVQPIGELA